MNIGRLDRKITIQTPTSAISATTGERTSTWATLDVVWATIAYPKETMSSDEGLEQNRTTTTTPVEFTIRWRDDVNEKMRVYYLSQYFEIRRINIVGQRNEMIKLVTEKKY